MLIESDKIIFACFDSSKQSYLSSSHLEKKTSLFERKVFFFNFFNFFNLMKRKRLTTSSHLTSSVLVYLLNLFWHCLFSFSISSSSSWWSLSFSVSLFVSLSVSFSVRDWISSMNSKHCLRIYNFIWHNRLHLHAFKLRKLSQCWIIERLFFRDDDNFLHFHINMMILHVLRHSSSVFRIWRSIARFYYLWFSYTKKRIDDFDLLNSFEFVNTFNN